MSRRLAALVALVTLVGPLAGQQPGQQVVLRRGSEVRVYTAFGYSAGRLVELSPTAIAVTTADRKVRPMDRSEVRLVKVREGGRWISIPTERLPSALAPGDDPPAIGPMGLTAGTRLRIASPRGRRVEGTLTEWRGDTVLLAAAKRAPRAVAIGPDSRIAVSAGRHGQALPGFLIGFALGAAGGGAGASTACGNFMGGGGDCGGATGLGVLAGGLVLGGVGAGVGSAIHSERWIELPPDSLRAYLASAPRPKQ